MNSRFAEQSGRTNFSRDGSENGREIATVASENASEVTHVLLAQVVRNVIPEISRNEIIRLTFINKYVACRVYFSASSYEILKRH